MENNLNITSFYFCLFEVLHLNSFADICDFIRRNNRIHNQNDLALYCETGKLVSYIKVCQNFFLSCLNIEKSP